MSGLVPASLLRLSLCTATVATLFGNGCASAPPPKGPLPICAAEVAGEQALESQSQELTADIWFSIMLKGFDRNSMQVATPLKDCTGRSISLDDAANGETSCPAEAAPGGMESHPNLDESDLVTVPIDDTHQLVWIKAQHYSTGEAMGPIAIAEWTDKGIAIRALGRLTAQSNKARFRIETTNAETEDEQRVLVVESDICPVDNPNACHRQMRLVPIVANEFVPSPLLGEDAASCLGPAIFDMHQQHLVILENGLERTFELTRMLQVSETSIQVSEQVTVKDRDPNNPDSPPKVFRNANIVRPLQVTETGIVSTGGLWESMISQHGSVSISSDQATSGTDTQPADQ